MELKEIIITVRGRRRNPVNVLYKRVLIQYDFIFVTHSINFIKNYSINIF